MAARRLACPKCQVALPEILYFSTEFQPCPNCRSVLSIRAYTSLLSGRPTGQSAETVQLAGDASCFYHSSKKAAVVCDQCGRFLCSVCDVPWSDQHFCPGCLEAGRKKGKIVSLENQRVLYDSVALALATYPLLLWWFTLLTAPVAIFVAIRYWKRPSSIIPRSHWRSVLAIILALLQIVGWIAFFGYVGRSRHFHS